MPDQRPQKAESDCIIKLHGCEVEVDFDEERNPKKNWQEPRGGACLILIHACQTSMSA